MYKWTDGYKNIKKEKNHSKCFSHRSDPKPVTSHSFQLPSGSQQHVGVQKAAVRFSTPAAAISRTRPFPSSIILADRELSWS